MKNLKRNFHFDKIDSTSAFLKCRRFSQRNFTFVSAGFQTAGHGRMGRTWVSGRNENLLFSVLIKDKKLIKNFSSVSLAVAVTIFKTLEEFGFNDICIKWPNDVYASSKKICGVLLESTSDNGEISSLIIGVGLNVNAKDFNGEFITPPTSMFLQAGEEFPLDIVKKKVYKNLKKELILLKKGKSDYLLVAKQNNFLKGKKVFAEINGEKTEILVKDIADNNALVYELNGKENTIFAGEITIHI